ncbi:MAG: hypothetical protein C4558_02685 [Dehalococcoidia bacterium]|nr:MAG: hypothetical protein C4558_02685 [Dehalococcoidia bacterium]
MVSPHSAAIRLLLSTALALFTFTVVIGILNGIDLVEFSHKALLTHVHVGTLGWITMGVIASALWLFAMGDTPGKDAGLIRLLGYAAPLSITAYSLAFLTTTNVIRPLLGALVGLVILATFLWTARQARGRTLSVPHIGILGAVMMSVLGAVLGILLGLRLAGNESITIRTADAHPAAMVVGFLVPVGMALAEWALDGTSTIRRATTAGWFQIGLPLLGGIFVIIGLLADIVPLVTLSLPFEVIGLIILVIRMRPSLMATSLTATATARHGLMALVYLIVNLGIFVYLIGKYFSKEIDPPVHLLLALDHSMFIGVMTNGLLALIMRFRRPVAPMVDHLVFVGVNAGIAVFIVGLLAESAPLKQLATPVMGGAILLAVATGISALRGATQDAST